MSAMLLLAVAVAFILPGLRTQEIETQCRLVGDCSSRILYVNTTDTMQECREFGRRPLSDKDFPVIPGAKDPEYISWNSKNNLCMAYESCSDIITDRGDAASTFSSHLGCICQRPVLCNGLVISTTIVAEEASCDQKCQQNDACMWFTYFSDMKACVLMKDCSVPPPPCDNCLTSQKACGVSFSPDELANIPPVEPQQSPTVNESTRLLYGFGRDGMGWKTLHIMNPNNGTEVCRKNLGRLMHNIGIYGPILGMTYLEETRKFVACGKGRFNGKELLRCLSYNGTNWDEVTLNDDEYPCGDHVVSSVAPSGLWIYGAQSSGQYSPPCLEGEMFSKIFDGERFSSGPPSSALQVSEPTTGKKPCLVRMNNTHTMKIGNTSDLQKTYIYNWETSSPDGWREHVPLNYGRGSPSCVAVQGKGVLVGGGKDADGKFVKVFELFDEIAEEWITLPSLPESRYPETFHLLARNDDVLAIFNSKVYKMADDFIAWNIMKDITLPNPSHALLLDHLPLDCDPKNHQRFDPGFLG